MAQMGFFDLSDRYASLDAKKDPLVEIDAVVPWEEFRPVLERCGATSPIAAALAWLEKQWWRGNPHAAYIFKYGMRISS